MIVEYHREVKQNSEEDVKMIRRIIQIDREKCNGCAHFVIFLQKSF